MAPAAAGRMRAGDQTLTSEGLANICSSACRPLQCHVDMPPAASVAVCRRAWSYVFTATTSRVYSTPGFRSLNVRDCSLTLVSATLIAAAPGRSSRSTTAHSSRAPRRRVSISNLSKSWRCQRQNNSLKQRHWIQMHLRKMGAHSTPLSAECDNQRCQLGACAALLLSITPIETI